MKMESTLFRVVDILNIHKISYRWRTAYSSVFVQENRILLWDLDINITVDGLNTEYGAIHE